VSAIAALLTREACARLLERVRELDELAGTNEQFMAARERYELALRQAS
jgi:hypothetical protein